MALPIRVTHLITSLNTGGAEMALFRLLSGMNRQDFETQVVCMIPVGPVGEKIRALGIPVISLEMPPGKPTLRGFFQLLRLLKQFRPAILQTWLYHADLMGLLAGKLAGIKTIIWNIRAANMDFEKYGNLSGLVFKICASVSNAPNAIVVNSHAGKAVHTRLGYHPKEWLLIPNGIDIAQFQPDSEARERTRKEWKITENEFMIGLVGRLDPMKDHPTFLKAAAIVQFHYPQTRFICVGDGPINYRNELKQLANQLKISNFLLWDSCSNMPAFYNALDILISSSTGEGFPNVVAEAMSCGKPCVVTNVGDSAMLVGESGISVPPSNPEALAQAIEHILGISEHERIQLGEKARRCIVENFSIETMIHSYSMLYTNLAGDLS